MATQKLDLLAQGTDINFNNFYERFTLILLLM